MTTILSFALLLQNDFGDAAGGAAMLGMGLLMLLVAVVLSVAYLIGMWKVRPANPAGLL